MDNLTHTLFAATLARTPLARAGRGTTAALLLGSNAPDVDVVSAAGGALSYLRWHRGPTHGVLGVVALGAVSAAIVFGATRVSDRRRGRDGRRAQPEPPASFTSLLLISTVAVALHVLMDLPTSYGTRLLSPFDWHWYAFDWLPIVDIYLLAALAVGLLFGSAISAAGPSTAGFTGDSRARFATIVLALMALDYGLRATTHHQALARVPELLGPLLPPACDPAVPPVQAALARWPAPARLSSAATPKLESPRRPCLVEIAAIPTFLSPFRWRVIAHLSNSYELQDIDLFDASDPPAAERTSRLTVRYPNQWTTATARAARTPFGATFLGFSRFPAARAFADAKGNATVRWSDVRFAGGFLSLTDRTRRPGPFALTIKLDPSGRVLEEQSGQ